jgi:hypothetical protein
LEHFTNNLADRVVDDIIHFGGHTHVVPESTLRERIMRDMCGSPLARNFGNSYEYGTPQETSLLFREVFRLHGLLEYIDGDWDNKFLGTIW